MRFCGIDLHSNNSFVAVTDETDKVLASHRCPNDLPKILALRRTRASYLKAGQPDKKNPLSKNSGREGVRV